MFNVQNPLKSIVFIFSLFVSTMSLSQNFDWAGQMGGSGSDEGKGIAADAFGNVYVTGYFSSNADLDPGPTSNTQTSAGGKDIFVSKINSSGALVWSKKMGGTGDDEGNAIAIDNNGDIWLTGSFSGIANFNSAGTSTLNSFGSKDIFVCKLSPAGNLLWAGQFGGSSEDVGLSITTDNSGNALFTGYFQSTADFDPGAGTSLLGSAGNKDIFITKLNPSGTLSWARAIGGASVDISYSIKTDASGNVFTTGFFSGTVDFNPGAAVFNLVTCSLVVLGNNDVFISRLDTQGNFLWAGQLTSCGEEYSYSIAIDNKGNIYTIGISNSNTDFDPGPGIQTLNRTNSGASDCFILKLDSQNKYVWAALFNSGLFASNTNTHTIISVDQSGKVYTAGDFNLAMDFDPGPAIKNFTTTSINDLDGYISILDSAGKYYWAGQIGGNGMDYISSIISTNDGHLHCTGTFSGTADLDPTTGTYSLTSYGNTDAFVLKRPSYIVGLTSNLKEDNLFNIYPNPFRDYLTINFQNTIAIENYEIKLLDVLGRASTPLSAPTKTGKEIDLRALLKGIYFLQVWDEGKLITNEKILKE